MDERKRKIDKSRRDGEFSFYKEILKWYGTEKNLILESLFSELPSFEKSFKIFGDPLKSFPTRFYEIQLENNGSLSDDDERIYEERDAFNSDQHNLSGETYFLIGKSEVSIVNFPEFHLPVSLHERGLSLAKEELGKKLKEFRPTIKNLKLDRLDGVDVRKEIFNLTTGQVNSDGLISGEISSQGFQIGSGDLSVSFQKGKFSGEISQFAVSSSLSSDIITAVKLIAISEGKEITLTEKVFFDITNSLLLSDIKDKPELFLRKSREQNAVIAELNEICSNIESRALR